MKDKNSLNDENFKPSKLTQLFILSPNFAILVVILFIISGIFAYLSMIKESLPDLEIPQAIILTEWAGADPSSVEQEVTKPIEKELKTLKGLKALNSASFDSFSLIAVEFVEDADLNESMQLLRTSVDDAEAELPKEIEKPVINQLSVDDRPILSIVLYGDVDIKTLSNLAEDLQDELEQISGVNEVELGGIREDVVHVQLQPNHLLGIGLSPTTVKDEIVKANVDMPWGRISSEEIGANVRLYGKFRDIEDLKLIPIYRFTENKIIRLREIANVYMGLEKEKTKASYSRDNQDYRRSIEMSVKKVSGFDTIAIIKNIINRLNEKKMAREWPAKVEFKITQNESEQIMDSLLSVFNNGWQAMLIVFIILLFLLSWREGLIVGLSIPITFLAAITLVWLIGYTMNELVIIGMVLALGLIVDVFILMMEGLHTAIFIEKLPFNRAAINTLSKYAIPAAAGQLTTILALAPLMAISGLAGKFIRIMPLTTIICLTMAFFVAILLSVPLSRFLLSKITATKSQETIVDKLTKKAVDKFKVFLANTFLKSKNVALLTVLIAFSIFIVTLIAFVLFTPIIMYPKSDGLKLGINIELPASTVLSTSEKVADHIGELLKEKSYLESVVKLVGKKSPFASASIKDALQPSEGEHFIGFSCMFVDRKMRNYDGYIYADELRDEIKTILDANYPGAKLKVVPDTKQPSAGAPIQIEISGNDLDLLREISNSLQLTLLDIEGAVDVRDNLGSMNSEINLKPKRETIDFYGLNQNDLALQIRFAMEPTEIAKFSVGDLEDDIPIQLSMLWPSRSGQIGGPTRLEELALVRAFTPKGTTVSLLTLFTPISTTAPMSITHKEGKRTITVSADTSNVPASAIINKLKPLLEKMKESWPNGYNYYIAGEAEESAETFGSAAIMLVVAVILVFGLLVLLYNSFAQSLMILMTMPLALIGTFTGFVIFRIPFSFFAMVGVISLIGIVVNNAIIMVDTINSYLKDRGDVLKAVIYGASERIRPIISTSLTTIVGLTPLAITNPMWRPLCLTIIFGLLTSTLISFFVVPALYYLFTKNSKM